MANSSDLVERIGALYFDDRFSDVTLIVEGKPVPGHKVILASSGDYFRALLYGNMQESQQSEVVLKDIPMRGFELVMIYIYTGLFEPEGLDEAAILEVLHLADLYGLETLSLKVCEDLSSVLSPENAFTFFEIAHKLELKELTEDCCRMLLEYPDAVLKNERFCQLSSTALHEIISRDTFCVDEIEIFKAVKRWAERNPKNPGLPKLLAAIRLPLIENVDLLTTVKNSNLITSECLIEAIESRELNKADQEYRGFLLRDMNLATRQRGARLITEKTNDGYPFPWENEITYDTVDMPTPAEFEILPDKGLTVALDRPFRVNNICFILARDDDDESSYSISTEVSMDLKNWHRIGETKHSAKGSFRAVFVFTPRVCRFVRILEKSGPTRLSELEVSFGGWVPEKPVFLFGGPICVPVTVRSMFSRSNSNRSKKRRWTRWAVTITPI